MSLMKNLGKPGEKSHYVVLRVPKDLKEELDALVEASGDREMTLSRYVRRVLEEHIAAKKKRK